MAYCDISGCKSVGECRDFLPENNVFCDAHCIELFKLVVEDCDEGISSDSMASAIAEITINIESKPIESILPILKKDDDEDLFFGTDLKR